MINGLQHTRLERRSGGVEDAYRSSLSGRHGSSSIFPITRSRKADGALDFLRADHAPA